MTMLANDESLLRLVVFITVLIFCLVAEHCFPRKQRMQPRLARWITNFSMTLCNTIALKILGVISVLSVAAYASDRGWGLLNLLEIPLWFNVLVTIALFDAAIYLQHIASHKIPLLWRFHRVHHADRDIDATTGIRFHLIEIVLSMIYKCFVVLVLGPATLGVFLFEVILNASAMFNHANIKLPTRLDKHLRSIIVTPDMHRIHHSILQRETDSNYGFFLSIWDQWFNTYNAQPIQGHNDMVIGLSEHQNNKPSKLWWSLKLPFLHSSSKSLKR